MRFQHLSLSVVLLAFLACHPGPKIGTAARPPETGGTIAGIVSTDGNAPLEGRRVTATNIATGTRYTATTASNGGYTMKVPEGSYRLEIQLEPGEKLAKEPGETKIDKSDLDPHRNFVITTGRVGK